MTIHWLPCGSESLHVMETCPNCYATEGGLLLGTAAAGYVGRISATCVDCGKTIDYYVDANVQKIWKLDPVESRRVPPEQ